MKKAAIIITSSVHVYAPYVKITEKEERIELTIQALKAWAKIYPQAQYILCDGSGFDFSDIVGRHLPDQSVECISFNNSHDLVEKYGKGYGEGEILLHAINNSCTISRHTHFIKCTSKLFVTNAKNFNVARDFLCNYNEGYPSGFRLSAPEFIDTRFYVASIRFYLEYLKDAHLQVRDREGYFLEHSFKDAIVNSGLHPARYASIIKPIIGGRSGSTGEVYSISAISPKYLIKRAIKIMLAKLYALLGLHPAKTDKKSSFPSKKN